MSKSKRAVGRPSTKTVFTGEMSLWQTTSSTPANAEPAVASWYRRSKRAASASCSSVSPASRLSGTEALDVGEALSPLVVDPQEARRVGEADLLQVAEDGVYEGRVRTDRPPNRVTDSDDA